MIKTVNQLNRLKTNVPFSQRLNDWINEWFEQHKQYFVFVDVDDFNGDDIEGTFRSHQKRFHEEGVIHIWTGASDSTIFGSNEMNYKFRAWHDYFHITRGFGYDFAGESIVCQIQKEMIPDDWAYEKELIHCEIIGQAQFFVHNGYFIDNQRLFTIVYLNYGIDKALRLQNDDVKEERQRQLFYDVRQKAGINIVTCGNCGATNLHKLELEGTIICSSCNQQMDKSDCPDLYN